MTFNQDNFSPMGSNSTNSPDVWSYKTDDDALTVEAAGYFIDKQHQLNRYDMIYVSSSDRQVLYSYLSPTEELRVISPTVPIVVLRAFSIVNQQADSLDTVKQIEYGAAQGSPDDDASIDAAGVITIQTAGFYEARFTFHVGRTGSSGGVAHVFVRGLVNGEPNGNPVSTLVDNPDIIIPEQFSVSGSLSVGDEIVTQQHRDSSGTNEGGLFSQVSAIGWGSTPSASVVLSRVVTNNE